MKANIKFRESLKQEDYLIAEHFYKMWLDIRVPSEQIEVNWENITIKFIQQARHNLAYKAFIAEIEGQVIGSASCQLFTGLYPHILKSDYRNYGYIWGVYVESPYRNQGIGKKSTQMTVEYLKSLGCTSAVLNASPLGKSVYEYLGFIPSNAMYLDLVEL